MAGPLSPEIRLPLDACRHDSGLEALARAGIIMIFTDSGNRFSMGNHDLLTNGPDVFLRNVKCRRLISPLAQGFGRTHVMVQWAIFGKRAVPVLIRR